MSDATVPSAPRASGAPGAINTSSAPNTSGEPGTPAARPAPYPPGVPPVSDVPGTAPGDAPRATHASGLQPTAPLPPVTRPTAPTAPRAPRSIYVPRPGVVAWSILSVLAAALFAVSVPLNAGIYGVPVAAAFLLGVLQCGSILLAVQLPKAAIVTSLIPVVAVPLLAQAVDAPWPWPVAGLIAQCAVLVLIGLRNPWRLSAVAWALSVAASVVVSVAHVDHLGGAITSIILFASISAPLLALAVLLAQRENAREQLHHERQLTAAEQGRRELVEERNRIARELHDVVAHSMSVIQVQATTAPYRLPGMDAATTAEFTDIAASARAAMREMRRLLGVLREDDTSGELAPQPQLSAVPELATSARRAGVPVSLEIENGLTDGTAQVPETTAVAAYRIVQEALSNVIRHAPQAPTAVRIERAADATLGAALHLTIANDAASRSTIAPGVGSDTPPLAATDSGGHGLLGMRERAALLGGHIRFGSTDAGGYTVEAWLPLDAAGIQTAATHPADTASDAESEPS